MFVMIFPLSFTVLILGCAEEVSFLVRFNFVYETEVSFVLLLKRFNLYLNTTCSCVGVYTKPEYSERAQNSHQNFWKETCYMKRNIA